MISYIIKKIGQTILVVLIVTFISFIIMSIIPGDAVTLMLGLDATPEKVQELREELNLDKPFMEQYALWLVDAAKGDLGISTAYRVPVTEVLGKRMIITFRMGLIALALSTIIGLFLGITAAVNRGKLVDNIISVGANIGISMPAFWIGILFIYFFAMTLKILPVQGYTDPSADLGMHIKQMIMPWIVTAMGGMASLTRQARSSVLETINQDFVRTARSKGLKEKRILYKHILKNAMIPILTLLGMQIRVLFGGVVLVETIFNIPGMGRLMVDSVFNRDIPVIQGCILVMGIVVVLANLLVDISYGLVDPRIRQGSRGNS